MSAINRLRFHFRVETHCQNFNPTASFTDRLGVIFPKMGAFQKQRKKGGWEGEVGEEGSCQPQCGFRTAPADVGRATPDNSLSLGGLTKSGMGRAGKSRLYQRIPEQPVDTEPSLRTGSPCM